MNRIIDQFLAKEGAPPGTLVHVGRKYSHEIEFHITEYNQDSISETLLKEWDSNKTFDSDKFYWINVSGVHEVERVRALGEAVSVPKLAIEDILNTEHSPKIEILDEHVFVMMKMIRLKDEDEDIHVEQISFILGSNYLVSFQQESGDVFEAVRKRLDRSSGAIRTRGSDYLLFALMDVIVDHYLIVAERLGERVALIEEQSSAHLTDLLISRLSEMRLELSAFRRHIAPITEVCYQIMKGDLDMIRSEQYPFFRDIYDHNLKAVEAIDRYKEMLTSVLETHMLLMSHRSNEIMKFLTIFASIFIPLTFIAGVYGMNFQNMPELQWGWGYPMALITMALLAAVLLIHFKRKNWL